MSREVELAIREARRKKLAMQQGIPYVPEADLEKISEIESEVVQLKSQISKIPTTIQKVKGEKGEPGLSIKGEPGKDGRTPIKGKDYFTSEEIRQFKNEVTPKKGIDYKDGKDGLDGTADTPYDVRDKLSTLRGTARLDAKYIKNIADYVSLSVTQVGGSSGSRVVVSDTAPLNPKTNDLWVDTSAI